MCGILGGNNRRWNYEAGISVMKHRGPDGIRVENFGEMTLAFARLAIVDLSKQGMQPMYTADRQVSVVFNGEIYGYQKLRKTLEKKYKFHSHTDTEVLLYSYLEYGDDFIHRLDGMFAIAIYDKRTDCLKLFRDRVGIKPLYYYYNGQEIAFSSELRGLYSLCADTQFIVDKTALYDYLTYSFIPEPKTLYKKIYKLEPATCLYFDLKAKKIVKHERYWDIIANTGKESFLDISSVQEELRDRIHKSVKEQMIADVPVGVMTSGGVDSSIITYESAQINPEIETFTMGVTDKQMDESAYAKILTDFLNLKTNIKFFSTDDLYSMYEMMPEWFGEPFADRSAFITYKLMAMACKKVKVLLSGDGGDEIFGGYGWQHMQRKRNPFQMTQFASCFESYTENLCNVNELRCKKKLDEYFVDDITWSCGNRCFMMKRDKRDYRKRLGIPIDYDDYWFIRKFYHKELPSITREQIIDFHTYLSYILNKVDKVSMALSIEVRVPLLSKSVIEYSFSLPQDARCEVGKPKELLKKAYGMLPRELFYRNKIGFSISQDYFGVGKRSNEIMLHQLWSQKIGKEL